MLHSKKVLISEVIDSFNLEAKDNVNNIEVSPGSLKKKGKNRLYWLKHYKYYNNFQNGFVIISKDDYEYLKKEQSLNKNLTHLMSNQKVPRLVFSQILAKFFNDEKLYRVNDVENHRTNKKIFIGENVFIGLNVTIGEGTTISHNCVINKDTEIGENCVIKENCTIATEGLGYEFFENEWVKFPQIGGVTIEDNVTFGPHSTIRRGALDNTIVRKGCKIGALSNIGHNCDVGQNALLTCQCVIGGSTKTGENLFMGIQSSIRNGLKIGNDITIGQGGIVTKSFLDSKTILIGNPAEPIAAYKNWSTIKKEIILSNS